MRRDQGAALLLVLAAVALLTVLAVELASRASADSLRATRSARDAAFRRIHDSGVEIARGLVLEPAAGPSDHWGEAWNREVTLTLGADEKGVVRVADENGKINIARIYSHPNEASWIRARLARLFQFLKKGDKKEAKIWKELEENVSKRLDSRDPVFTLDAFREVGLESLDDISRYLTCFGDGLVNLNTAPRAVLYSLDPELDEAMVERIAKYRGKGEGEPGLYKAFVVPQDLMLVEGIVTRTLMPDGQFRVTRNLYEKIQALVTVKSSCFSARVIAETRGKSREAWGFFKPTGERIAFEEILP